jgi:hypothetical protein
MRQLPARSLPCALDATDNTTYELGAGLAPGVPTRDLTGKTIQGGHGYTGTITIEGRILPDKWFSLGTVAADAKLAIDGNGLVSLEEIRTNVTTVTGGATAPAASLAAFDARGD